jgi:hypothetical protein
MTTATPIDLNRRLLNRTGAGVAGSLMIILAGALWEIMGHEIPEKNHDIVLILITTVCNAVIGVTGYFFASSVQARNQSDIIATQASTAATLAAQHAGTTTTTTTTAPPAPVVPIPTAGGDVQVEIPPGVTANVHAVGALVKPAEVLQTDWDAMTDADKAAVVLRYAK